MPKSARSFNSVVERDRQEDEDYHGLEQQERDDTISSTTPTSPTATFRPLRHGRASDTNLLRHSVTERSSLLGNQNLSHSYASMPGSALGTPRPHSVRHNSQLLTSRRLRHHERQNSFSQRLVSALGERRGSFSLENSMQASMPSLFQHDRVWYDQFTSTDWVHDSIADAFRVKALRSRKDIRGRIAAWFDGAQGWILVAIIGILTAFVAYLVNISESTLFDLKQGYCSTGWYMSKKGCCAGATICDDWMHWSRVMHSDRMDRVHTQYAAFVVSVILLSSISCVLTLATKTVVPSAISISTLDENLGAEVHRHRDDEDNKHNMTPQARQSELQLRPPMIYYSAAGSGVAEVKVILSGFVLHGYLGLRTLVIKTLGLILSVASGLSLGKEGPYVHIATAIGNIACRMFPKYRDNDGKRREILSASAAAGVAVAFGAPIGGVLFSLEEVSYYFPSKTLFRTFFCCIVSHPGLHTPCCQLTFLGCGSFPKVPEPLWHEQDCALRSPLPC